VQQSFLTLEFYLSQEQPRANSSRPDFSFSYTLPSNYCIVGLLQGGGASDLFLQASFDELLRVLFPIK
jgi:hypothetical protein